MCAAGSPVSIDKIPLVRALATKQGWECIPKAGDQPALDYCPKCAAYRRAAVSPS